MVVVLVALLCALGVADAAQASTVGISHAVAWPHSAGSACAADSPPGVDGPAGAHRDFCLAFDLDTSSDDVKKIVISLPAGVVGDPTATPRCAFSGGGKGSCGTANEVGDVSSTVNTMLGDQSLTGEVYNLTPAAGEPARLGIALDGGLVGGLSPTYLQASIRVRVPDAGLDSVTDNVPNQASILGIPSDISVKSMALNMWGSNGDHGSMSKSFISLPTRCDVAANTTFTATSYGGQTSTATAGFTPSDCAHLPFTPSLAVGPSTVAADTPGEAWAQLLLPAGDTNGRRQAYLKDVALKLPPGLALNPPLANGLLPCTPAEFGATVDATPKCAANTVMGTVEFQTPIFPGETLTGKVYFGTPLPFAPLVNFISVEDPRLRVKLTGYATIDPITTAITAHFENQPQVPFTSFKFTYIDPGDGRATLTSPIACGDYPVTAEMTPWGGGAPVSPTKTFKVNTCPPEGFAPTVSDSVSTTQAGADTGLTVHIVRPDKQQRLQNMTVSLPPGLIGRLTTIPQCAVADARAARCPASSQVGTARVTVGTGPAPLPVPGKVYLTQGFDGGIAGLAVVVDTKQPALDLGLVTVMNKLVLRPDAGVDVVTEPLPQSLQGIPTVYRSIDLTIDKPGFMLNGTSCAAQQIHATFMSTSSTTATSDAPYQTTGCDKLPFGPALSAAIGSPGETGKFKHPPLVVTITQQPGEAAIGKTVVSLPEGVGVDLKNLGGLCTSDQLNAGQCPANSQIGTVSAETPLLPQKLTGGAYLLKPDTPGLPGLALDLGGLVRLKGSVALGKRLVTTFPTVPDVPLRRLVLTLTGGPKGTLTTANDLCSGKAALFDGAFTSQSGKATQQTAPGELIGCGPLSGTGVLSGVAKRRPTLRMTLHSTVALKELHLRLPKGTLRPASLRVLRRARMLLGGHWARDTKIRWSKGSIVFRASNGTSTKAPQITIPRGVLKQRKRIRSGSVVTMTVVGIGTDRKSYMARIPVIAR